MTATAKKNYPSPRIEAARRGLIERGFRCLSGGKFGLPSYTDIEAWAKGSLVVYLIYDRKEGGWDILCQIDETNTINGTWQALETMQEPFDTVLDKAR